MATSSERRGRKLAGLSYPAFRCMDAANTEGTLHLYQTLNGDSGPVDGTAVSISFIEGRRYFDSRDPVWLRAK